MTLTRKFIAAHGVTEDADITAILNAHHEELQGLKDGMDKTAADLKNAQAALKEAQEEKDDDGWKQKYEAEQAAHNATKDGYATEKDGAETAALLKAVLSKGGANPAVVDLLVKEIDIAGVKKATKDGAAVIENADALLAGLKTKHAGLFGKTEQKPAPVGGGVKHEQISATSNAGMNAFILGASGRQTPAAQ
jgi:hypothetical protein